MAKGTARESSIILMEVHTRENGRTTKSTARGPISTPMEVCGMMENTKTIIGMEMELATTKTVIYTGEWHANIEHGKGVMTYANQDIYDGEWK
eukprot:scaffold8400_cov213-Skeletonema_marinoi.AAC.2